MKLIETIADSRLLAHLAAEEIDLLATTAHEARYSAGEVIFNEDEEANTFYIVREGKIGLELTSPRRRPIVIQTLGHGDLVGLSWMFPPYRWSWRARAIEDTSAVAFDAVAVRRQCETDSHLALVVLRIVADQAVARLHSSRTQMLDLYEFPR